MKNEENNSNHPTLPDNYVVGIGASAGGLEAMQKFLSALPSNTGFPYIVVQHLSPDYKSLLSEILGKYTTMPVVQVENDMEVQPNCVYVIKPGMNMRISRGKLLLSPQKEHELNLPIDLFFKSLADYAGSKAIAIILSGTGSDGSNGIKSIKEANGMIITQNPESAKFDGMPKSALRTGLVDAQIRPEEIALEIEHISAIKQKKQLPQFSEQQIDEELMKKIYVILKKISNVNFTHYKQTTILRRIERRMMIVHKESLTDYVTYLYETPEEVKILSKEVLIGVTSFFRDPEYFESLRNNVLQNLIINHKPYEQIRIWVAGCSTGEEAYSIAILLCEVMESLKTKCSVKIFATDLDVEAITAAGKGIYGENIIESVSSIRLSRYFTKSGNSYAINREIRRMIVFSPHNVFQDPPFGRLDLISCRNMLIYFQSVLQNDLFAIFHSALKDGGYLFLGKSEAIGAYTEVYPVIDISAKIFTHRSDVKITRAKLIPYLGTSTISDILLEDSSRDLEGHLLQNKINHREETDIVDELLERFMPACIVVNDRNEIVHTYGDNVNYTHFPLGKVSIGLFDVITEALKIPASTLLKEARQQCQAVQYKNIHLEGEHESTVVNLTAMPMKRKSPVGETYFALIIFETSQRGELAEAIPYKIDRVASQRIADLEQELATVHDKLKQSVSEQECVNEELQAANEELLTANEELQSSNEELQSVNEELYTVNSEYQQKLTEIANVNDDIANFLSSTMIGIIFVDNKLNIRRYTNYVATEFNVMDHDIGRSLNFISYHFPTIDISEICDNVLKTLLPDEREITTGKEKSFFMRVAPYRTTENKILGCVITLVDITSQKQGLAMLKNTEQQLSLAQQDNDEKREFLSKISHEIKAPIGMISGLSDIAKTQLNDPKELDITLCQISETIKYMNSLVSDISNMSKGYFTDANEQIDITETLNEVRALIEPRAKVAELDFQIDAVKKLSSRYYGSQSRVKQILINFLTNSIKYTKPGGYLLLRVKEDLLDGNQSQIVFVVKDTGIGISKEFIPKLFSPYTRENRQDKDEKTSMGLGLSIAYNLIQMMGGDVKVESEIGQGTTFTIRILLDRVQSEIKEHTQNEKIQEYSFIGMRAIIADDNALNRKILNTILSNKGIIADEVCDGEEAVKLFSNSPDGSYDCIFMDIRMPRMDGIEATKEIREMNRSDGRIIPIIGVSANGFTDDIEMAKRAGINAYTTKPINSNNLFQTLESCLKEKA